MNRSPTAAILELVFASLLWGFGFIATVWALRDMSPLALTTTRFALAAIVASLIVCAVRDWRAHLTREQFRLAFWPGLFLALTLILQTWGLKYTTATKSGFVTTLYVLVVPMLDLLILKRKLHRLHSVYVAIAIAGTALICNFHGGNWNIGDLLTLLCAFAASLQIFWFGLIHDRIGSAFTFNFLQSVWAGLIVLPLAAAEVYLKAQGSDTGFGLSLIFPVSFISWSGLLILALGSTLIAFSLQVRAQQVLSPSLASLIYLLESPFATLFAITLLGEVLQPSQWVGAAMILLAVSMPSWAAFAAPKTLPEDTP